MKYLAIITNWRIMAITALAALTLILALCESEDIAVLLGTKAMALITGYAVHALSKRWEGKMPELDFIAKQQG